MAGNSEKPENIFLRVWVWVRGNLQHGDFISTIPGTPVINGVLHIVNNLCNEISNLIIFRIYLFNHFCRPITYLYIKP